MKKLIGILVIIIFGFLGCVDLDQYRSNETDLNKVLKQAEQSGGKWSDYGTLAASTIVDTDDFMVRDVSDTSLAATGTQKIYPWTSLKADMLTDWRDLSSFSTWDGETQTTFSEANMRANKYISNQAGASEIDIIVVAVSYPINFVVLIEEVFLMEIAPPSGESFDLDGVVLTANFCIESPAVVGSKAVFTRMQIADASWQWSVDTVRGTWIDGGDTGD